MGEGAHDVVFADGTGSAAGCEPGGAVWVWLVFCCVMSTCGMDVERLTCMLRGTRGRKVGS